MEEWEVSGEPADAPVLTMVALMPGIDKAAALAQVRVMPGFPEQLLADTIPDCDGLVVDALTRRQSIAVESSLEHHRVLHWAALAEERGYVVELVVLDTDEDVTDQLRGRARRRRRLQQQIIQRRMSAAVDMARRVVLIDFSNGRSSISARIDSAKVKSMGNQPRWIARRVLAPQLARKASMAAIRGAYTAIAQTAPVQPILQMAVSTAGVCTGAVVARSEFHLLQQVGEALHVIHDIGVLGLVPGTASVLAVEAAVTLVYDQSKEAGLDRSAER